MHMRVTRLYLQVEHEGLCPKVDSHGLIFAAHAVGMYHDTVRILACLGCKHESIAMQEKRSLLKVHA